MANAITKQNKDAVNALVGSIMGCTSPQIYQLELYFEGYEEVKPDVRVGFSCLSQNEFEGAVDDAFDKVYQDIENIGSIGDDIVDKLESKGEFMEFQGRIIEFDVPEPFS